MKKATLALTLILIFAFANIASADEWWAKNLTILGVTQLRSGRVQVNVRNPNGDESMFLTAAGDLNTKAILVALLAAQAGNEKVNLMLDYIAPNNVLVEVTVLSNIQ